jgi:hypothetical protein
MVNRPQRILGSEKLIQSNMVKGRPLDWEMPAAAGSEKKKYPLREIIH